MKRLLLLIAAALYCSLAYSQDAGNVGNGAQLSIVSRLDAEPYFSFDPGGENGITLGTSSIYTFLEGTLWDTVGYSVSNHWLSTDYQSLYDYLGYSCEFNWLDWAYVTIPFGDFEAEIGKDVLGVASYEFDANDVDMFWQMCSTQWNNLQCYQWGAKLAWYPTETAMIRGEITSSPFTLRPFEDGIVCAGLMVRDDMDGFSWMASANMFGNPEGNAFLGEYLGAQWYGDNLTLGAEASMRNVAGSFWNHEFTIAANAEYNLSDALVVKARAGIEDNRGLELFSCPKCLYGGLSAEYDLSNALDGLSLHCAFGGNNFENCAYLTIGAKYNFTLNF